MAKVLRVLIWFAGTLITMGIASVGWQMWSTRNIDYAFSDARSLQENVSGRWDWSTRSAPCTDSAHTIAFSSDGKVMTITQQQPAVDSSGNDWTVSTYDIDTITASRVRGTIRGETRLTPDGDPVEWELVVVDADRYHWHRTDWASFSLTAGIVRCRK